METFTAISPISNGSSSVSPSAHSTITCDKDDFLSSFTTLGDDESNSTTTPTSSSLSLDDDKIWEKQKDLNDDDKVGEKQKDQRITMITPPMSQKNQQDIKTPLNYDGKMISRNEFVDSLISAASILLELIWPKNFDGVQIKWFLKETLRRSRSSYCILQMSLYYIYKLQPKIHMSNNSIVFQCPKRCFLTCLILASKFLQDRNYSMKTWSKICGLPLKELTMMEFHVLKAIDYNLNLNTQLYLQWSKLLLVCTYVNNTTITTTTTTNNVKESNASDDEYKLDLATTLLDLKKQRLAQIFARFNQKMLIQNMTTMTNATSHPDVFVVVSDVIIDNEEDHGKVPLKRKLEVGKNCYNDGLKRVKV